MREDGCGPAGTAQLRDLPGAEFLRLAGIQREQSQFTPLSQHNQFAVRYDGRPESIHPRLSRTVRTPPLIPAPHQLAGFELDAAKGRVRLVAAAEGVKIADRSDEGSMPFIRSIDNQVLT